MKCFSIIQKVAVVSAIAFTLIVDSAYAETSMKFGLKSGISEFLMEALDGEVSKEDMAKAGVHIVAATGAMPATVTAASALGVEATTGTAIASLSGAAAVSATSYAVGAPVAGVLSTMGIVVAPAVVGGVVIASAATLVALGVNALFFSEE
ncbi:MAG: hypothetical protein L3J47_12470 [Sulfurovum sp.]|nr:hypothetical protein [Sulfurovum sp.]